MFNTFKITCTIKAMMIIIFSILINFLLTKLQDIINIFLKTKIKYEVMRVKQNFLCSVY